MSDVTYHLRDRNDGMVAAWRDWFAQCPEVEISLGEIFAGPKADAIVSPANSFGYMDGGIDLVYAEHFGWDIQKRLQKLIADEHDGELPVGQAAIVETNHADFPFMVSAPTMRVPMYVADTVNAYLAFRAAIRAVKEHNRTSPRPIRSVLCPGLGTAVGKMEHWKSAKQMLLAYLVAAKGRKDVFDRASKVLYNHAALLSDEPFRID